MHSEKSSLILTSLGARLTLEVPGLPPQTCELAAGGGYLSQSAPVAWFGLGSGDTVEDAVVRVRWPDGATSEHPVPAGATTLRLARP